MLCSAALSEETAAGRNYFPGAKSKLECIMHFCTRPKCIDLAVDFVTHLVLVFFMTLVMRTL